MNRMFCKWETQGKPHKNIIMRCKQVIIIDDKTRLCESCLDELDYFYCDNCNEYWLADVIESYELKDGRTICEHCYEALLEDEEITEDDIVE